MLAAQHFQCIGHRFRFRLPPAEPVEEALGTPRGFLHHRLSQTLKRRDPLAGPRFTVRQQGILSRWSRVPRGGNHSGDCVETALGEPRTCGDMERNQISQVSCVPGKSIN